MAERAKEGERKRKGGREMTRDIKSVLFSLDASNCMLVILHYNALRVIPFSVFN